MNMSNTGAENGNDFNYIPKIVASNEKEANNSKNDDKNDSNSNDSNKSDEASEKKGQKCKRNAVDSNSDLYINDANRVGMRNQRDEKRIGLPENGLTAISHTSTDL